ncbi:MAG: InlB B-repeat-containing protein [Candidatus Methanomethylophilaceae archaeon]|nr:InlB B-repeat-containing protein [Candidatus Methanomethylophilaceae archaeon]
MAIYSTLSRVIPLVFVVIAIIVIFCSADCEATGPVDIDGIEYIIENNEAEVINSDLVYVRIPSTITYETVEYPVTSIRSSAFANKDNLYIVDVPESVINMGSNIVKGSPTLSHLILNQTQLPTMANNTLFVESDCNLYCAFSLTLEQLSTYAGGSDIDNYLFVAEKPAVVHYKDVVHQADNFAITTLNATITINCAIPCTHCTLSSWTDNNDTYENGTSFTVAQYTVTLTPVLDQPVTEYEYYVDDTLYRSYSVAYHDGAPSVPDPEKEGHAFMFWVNVPPVGDEKRYTAIWNVLSYTIQFDTDGGSVKDPISVQYGATIDVGDEPTKAGHSFLRWDPELPATMGSSDLQVVAIWNTLSFKLSFTDRDETTEQMVLFGSAVSIPEFVREGYHFVLDGLLEDTMPDYDLHYNVIWVPNQYRVSFFEGPLIKHEYMGDYGSDIIFPDIVKEGYHPDWGPITTIPAEDISVYVTWVINQHTISYTLPGGVVEQVYDYDSRIVPPPVGYKTGYYFESWTPAVPAFMPDSDLVFESVWRPTVTSDNGNFITGSGDSVIVSSYDLAGYDSVTFGVEGKWKFTFDPSFVSGVGNLKVSITEVSPQIRPNAPRGTLSLFLISVEDDGKRITSIPSAANISIEMGTAKGDPFVSIMEGDDPIDAGDVSYSDGKMSFSTASMSYMAAGFAEQEDEGFPIAIISVVAVAAVAVAAVAAYLLFRRERKV